MAGMVPEDVYELTGVADPRLSPDGRTVAFAVWRIDRDENRYGGAIWVAPVDGTSPPRQFTSGVKRDSSPRWSPDGTRLAFVSNRDGDHAQLYVMASDGGEPRKLTDCKEDVTDPVWSPDGTRIAFASRVPDPAYEEEDAKKRPPRRFTRLTYKLDNVGWIGDRRQHLFVVPVDGSSEPTQITDGDYEDASPMWSPDGDRIVFVSAREEDWDVDVTTDLYVVDAGGGEPTRITSNDGRCETPSWSPDGTRIAYVYAPGRHDDPRHGRIAVLDVDSGERTVLTEEFDRNCGPYPTIREPVWVGDALVFAAEDSGNTRLYRIDSRTAGVPEAIVSGELVLVGYDAVGESVVHAASKPARLAELFAGERQLTDVGKPFSDGRELVEPERFVAVSPDGAEVEAWVIRPSGFEDGTKYPMLLSIHGGPFTQYGNKFFDEFQVYAGAGYVVVYCNPRGSSGYSEEWGRAIRGPIEGGPGWGTVDYDDCMAVVDEAVKRFEFIDPDRLGVLGGSYGGYMTSWIVGHNDRFQAAISERAVNNAITESASDIPQFFKGEVGGHWFEDREAYLKFSPITYAKNITTPLLILHSENDLRCPIANAEELFAMLRILKREVEFVRFPEEGHELTRSGNPVHRVQRFEIVLDWFARYLKPESR